MSSTTTWTGTDGNGTWGDSSNWSSGTPQGDENVTIAGQAVTEASGDLPSGSAINLTLNGSATVLQVGDANFTLGGYAGYAGTISLAGTMSAQTVDNEGGAIVLAAGATTGALMTAGDLTTSSLTNTGAITLNPTGGDASAMVGFNTVDNSGALTLNAATASVGAFYGPGDADVNATVTNASTGVMDITGTTGAALITVKLTNAGILSLNSVNGIARVSAFEYGNATVQTVPTSASIVNSGTMSIQGLGAAIDTVGLTNSGTLTMAGGNGTSHAGAAMIISNLTNSGTLTMTSDATQGAASLGVMGHTNGGYPASCTLVNSGTIYLQGNNTTLASDEITNTAGAVISEQGNGGQNFSVDGTLTNSGSISLNSATGVATIGSAGTVGGVLTNESGATITVSGAAGAISGYALSNAGDVSVQATAGYEARLVLQGASYSESAANLLGNTGTLSLTGGAAWLQAGAMSNSGLVTLKATGEAYLTLYAGQANGGGTLTNSGTIGVSGGYAVLGSGALTNSGLIDVTQIGSGSEACFGATSVSNSGTVSISGSYANPNIGVLNNTTSTASFSVSGTGGISADLGSMNNAGTLSLTSADGYVNVGDIGYSGDAIANSGSLDVSGVGADIDAASLQNAGAMTIAAQSGHAGLMLAAQDSSTSAANFLTNTGTFAMSGASTALTAGALSNSGSFHITTTSAAATSYVSVSGAFTNSGTMSLAGGAQGAVDVGTTLTNSDNFSASAGSEMVQANAIANTGDFTVTATGASGWAEVTADSGGVINSGTMSVSGAGVEFCYNALSNSGTISLVGGASIESVVEGVPSADVAQAVNAAGGQFDFSGGGTFLMGSAMTNNGVIGVAADTTVNFGGVTAGSEIAGTGSITVASGADVTVYSGATINAGQTLALSGTGDEIGLQDGGAIEGSVTGIAAGDIIDLENVANATASFSGGVLSLSSGGAVVQTLNLAGDLSGLSFVTSSDNHGGTEVQILATTGTPSTPIALGTNASNCVTSGIVTITGEAVAGSVVTIFDGTTALGSVTVGTNGVYSFTTPVPLANGAHSITATAQGAGDAISVNSSAINLIVDSGTPVVTINTPTGGGSATSETISGTVNDVAPGATVSIYDNGGITAVATATLDSNGHWSASVPLVLGSNSLVASDTNLAGTTGSSAAVVETRDPGPTAASYGGTTGSNDVVAHNQTTDPTALVNSLVTPGLPGDTETITSVSGAHVSLVSGHVEYAALGAGTDSFTYTVTDQFGDSASGSVGVTIDGGATLAPESLIVEPTTTQDITALIHSAITPGLTGDTETITSVSSNAVLNTNGSVSYTAPATGASGLVTYTVTDQYGDVATGDVEINFPHAVTVVNLSGGNNTVLTPSQPEVGSMTSGPVITGPASGSAIITGTPANETINAQGSFNVINGDGGDDTINAGASYATVTVNDGDGDNVVNGGTGNGNITLGDGDNSVTTGGYLNVITLGNGNNIVAAGSALEKVTAGNGDNTISATGVSNIIVVGDGDNTINAGAGGNESVSVAGGTANVTMGGYFDALAVASGDVTLSGIGGFATVTLGADFGASANDKIALAGAGGDSVTNVNGVMTVLNANFTVLATIDAPAGKDLLTSTDSAGDLLVTVGTPSPPANPSVLTETAGGQTIVLAAPVTTLNLVGYFNYVSALSGSYTIDGGLGYASIDLGGNGNSHINVGGSGNSVTLGNGNNTVTTAGYANTIVVGSGDNSINAGAGVDSVSIGGGIDEVTAGGYCDSFNIAGGDVTLSGMTGYAIVTLRAGFGGSSNDKIDLAGAGGDRVTNVNGVLTVFNPDGSTYVTLDAPSGDVLNTSVNGAGDLLVTASTAPPPPPPNPAVLTETTGSQTIALNATVTTVNLTGYLNNVSSTTGGYTISGDQGYSTYDIGAGNNTLILGGEDETVTLGGGGNNVSGFTGDSTIALTGTGTQIVSGSGYLNTITLGNGDDSSVTVTNGGFSTVTVGNGNDTDVTLSGYDNKVTIGSGAGAQITTGDGNATVNTTTGSATVNLDGYFNTVTGGDGTAADTVTGGVFNTYQLNGLSSTGGFDVTDFNASLGDTLDLSQVTNALAPGWSLSASTNLGAMDVTLTTVGGLSYDVATLHGVGSTATLASLEANHNILA